MAAEINSNAGKSVYTLNHSRDIERLEWQHYRVLLPWVENSLIPENISKHIATLEAPRIADIACGTGVWAVELAKQLPPSATFHGYDFAPANFRSEDDLPPNVKLSFANALEPFPALVLGTYDVVHLRLLFLAFTKDQWKPVAENAVALLKPGGWLFWEDICVASTTMYPPSDAHHRFSKYQHAYAVNVGMDLSFPASLPSTYKEIGLVNITSKLFNTWKEDDAVFMETSKGGITALMHQLRGIVKDGGVEGMRRLEDVDELESQFVADIDAGSRIYTNLIWSWAQKNGAA